MLWVDLTPHGYSASPTDEGIRLRPIPGMNADTQCINDLHTLSTSQVTQDGSGAIIIHGKLTLDVWRQAFPMSTWRWTDLDANELATYPYHWLYRKEGGASPIEGVHLYVVHPSLVRDTSAQWVSVPIKAVTTLADGEREGTFWGTEEDADASRLQVLKNAVRSRQRREDAGEVILGARKHAFALTLPPHDAKLMIEGFRAKGLTIEEADRISTQAKRFIGEIHRDKVWPKGGLTKLSEDKDPIIALLARAIHSQLPRQAGALLHKSLKHTILAPDIPLRLGAGYIAMVTTLRERLLLAHKDPDRFLADSFKEDAALFEHERFSWSGAGWPANWHTKDDPEYQLPETEHPVEDYIRWVHDRIQTMPTSLVITLAQGGIIPAPRVTQAAFSVMHTSAMLGHGEVSRLAHKAMESLMDMLHLDYDLNADMNYEKLRSATRVSPMEFMTHVQQAFRAWSAKVHALEQPRIDVLKEALGIDKGTRESKNQPKAPIAIPDVPALKNPTPPLYQHLVREGPLRRTGDVTEDDLIQRFGLRGIQYGNYVKQDERAFLLNAAYDAFADIAEALGVPDCFMGLDGQLGLALGARGRGKASAHYEREYKVINLTKRAGAGALAHEWVHALDHWLGMREGYTAQYFSNLVMTTDAHRLYHKIDPEDTSLKARMQWFLTRSMLYDDMADAEDAHAAMMNLRISNALVDFKRAVLSPKVLNEVLQQTKVSADIASTWAQRIQPWLARIESGDMDVLFYRQGATHVFGKKHVIKMIEESVRDAGQPLTADEKDFLVNWVIYGMEYKHAKHVFHVFQSHYSKSMHTQFMASAIFLDNGKKGKYWSSVEEITARALSAVIFDRLQGLGIRNDFAVGYSAPRQFSFEQGYRASPNPEGHEIRRVVDAAEGLIMGLQSLAQEMMVEQKDAARMIV